ncbi:MAG: carbohydrate ABC transporter permease [Brevinematia bacterium]
MSVKAEAKEVKAKIFKKGHTSKGISNWLPKLLVSPSFVAMVVFIYGFIFWTIWISFTDSKLMPNYKFVGLSNYITLFKEPRWWVAFKNLFIFTSLFVLLCIIFGLILAILLDQKIKGEGVFLTIYLCPMAISLIVTGVAWKWILNPELGIERLVQQLGFAEFQFRWLVDSNFAIYTVVMAAVWQSTGYAMALFLAGLRGIDNSLIEAAKVDGANMFQIYTRVIIPCLRPVFLSCVVILSHIAIKTFDLVMALTKGGPGYATDVPATFMYSFAFNRGRLAIGAASAVIMFVIVISFIVPYLYIEREGR